MTPLRAPVSLGSFEPDGERRIDVDTPCPFCGYNLRGLVRGRACPECGEVDAPEKGRPVSIAAPEPGRPTLEDDDRACHACGYNLRGLPRGQRCPECGVGPGDFPRGGDRRYGDTRSRPLRDAVLGGSAGERRAWRIGLGLATGCVAVAALARVGYLLATWRGAGDALRSAYVMLCGANSIVWVVAVWLVTPASLGRHWSWMEGPRWAARTLSLLWLVGYACAHQRTGPAAGVATMDVAFGDYGGRFLGGVGAMFVAFILGWVAEEAELTGAARRLNAVVWLLWVPTLLAQAFPGSRGWLVGVFLGIVLAFWCWIMALMTLGIHELYKHGRWGHRLARSRGARAERIEGIKRAIDDQVGATVRPLSGGERSARD